MGGVISKIEQVTVIGTGLLGGSLGLAMRDRGFTGRIVGVGRSDQTLRQALELGCIDSTSTDLGASLRDSQLVVVATPLSVFPQVLEQVAEHDHAGLIVTDVGSTKQWVGREARRVLPEPRRFVGSHPMAGGERHGPQHARADLFQGKPCVIVDGHESDPEAVQTVESMWTELGMRLVRMTADEHDRAVAMTSHLPHLTAVLLVALAEHAEGLKVASTGFAATTRVASGDPSIWLDIFKTNQPAVVEAIRQLADQLSRFDHALTSGEDDQVMNVLEKSKAIRDQWAQTFTDRRRSTGSD